MSGHCRLMTTALNEWLKTDDAGIRLWGPHFLLADFRGAFTPEEYTLAQTELDNLPDSFLPQLVLAWRDADTAGIPFEIVSEAPEQRIDSARQGRVSVRIDYEETGVRMVVSHVHNRHASWMESKQLASV